MSQIEILAEEHVDEKRTTPPPDQEPNEDPDCGWCDGPCFVGPVTCCACETVVPHDDANLCNACERRVCDGCAVGRDEQGDIVCPGCGVGDAG